MQKSKIYLATGGLLHLFRHTYCYSAPSIFTHLFRRDRHELWPFIIYLTLLLHFDLELTRACCFKVGIVPSPPSQSYKAWYRDLWAFYETGVEKWSMMLHINEAGMRSQDLLKIALLSSPLNLRSLLCRRTFQSERRDITQSVFFIPSVPLVFSCNGFRLCHPATGNQLPFCSMSYNCMFQDTRQPMLAHYSGD